MSLFAAGHIFYLSIVYLLVLVLAFSYSPPSLCSPTLSMSTLLLCCLSRRKCGGMKHAVLNAVGVNFTSVQ